MDKMKNHMIFITILVIAWNVSIYIGSTERFYSNQFNSYVGTQLGDLENPMAGFLNTIPMISTFLNVIISSLILPFYFLTLDILNNRRRSIIIKCFIIFPWGIGIIAGTKRIFDNMLLMLQWKFYLSLIPNALILTIFILIAAKIFSTLRHSLKSA